MVRLFVVCACVAGAFVFSGCAAASPTTGGAAALSAPPADLAALYRMATPPAHRAVRKPARDAQALALARLALQAEVLGAEMTPPPADAQLAASEATDATSEAQRVTAQAPSTTAQAPNATPALALRAALVDLAAAARTGNLPAVHRSYERVCAAYASQPLGATQR